MRINIHGRQPLAEKYLRTNPAIILLESTIPQADPESEPVMSWIDLTNLGLTELYTKAIQRNQNKDQFTDSSDHPNEQMPQLEAVFGKEVKELFNIPTHQTEKTESSQNPIYY